MISCATVGLACCFLTSANGREEDEAEAEGTDEAEDSAEVADEVVRERADDSSEAVVEVYTEEMGEARGGKGNEAAAFVRLVRLVIGKSSGRYGRRTRDTGILQGPAQARQADSQPAILDAHLPHALENEQLLIARLIPPRLLRRGRCGTL